jgi:hypothetical protein
MAKLNKIWRLLATAFFCQISFFSTVLASQNPDQVPCLIQHINKLLNTSYQTLPSKSSLSQAQLNILYENQNLLKKQCPASNNGGGFGAHEGCCGANWLWVFGYCKGILYSKMAYYCKTSNPPTICPEISSGDHCET